jgi:uncharacterized protein (UPF0332 family)
MATWEQISQKNLRAAGSLLPIDPRSSVSRAYYAAFSALTHVMSGRIRFPLGRETPRHRDVPAYIATVFASRYPKDRRDLQTTIRRLYALRLQADYRSHMTIDIGSARDALRYAGLMLQACGVAL